MRCILKVIFPKTTLTSNYFFSTVDDRWNFPRTFKYLSTGGYYEIINYLVVVSLMYGENVCFIRFGSTFCIESWINKIIVYIYETLHLWLVEGLGNSKYIRRGLFMQFMKSKAIPYNQNALILLLFYAWRYVLNHESSEIPNDFYISNH